MPCRCNGCSNLDSGSGGTCGSGLEFFIAPVIPRVWVFMADVIIADERRNQLCANNKYFCANHSCIGFLAGL